MFVNTTDQVMTFMSAYIPEGASIRVLRREEDITAIIIGDDDNVTLELDNRAVARLRAALAGDG